MAKTKEISAGCKMSINIQNNYYTYSYNETLTLEPEDNIKEVTNNLWNKVINEVENQIELTYKTYNNLIKGD